MFTVPRIMTVVFALVTGLLSDVVIFWEPKKGGGKAVKFLFHVLLLAAFAIMVKYLLTMFSWFGVDGMNGFVLFLVIDIAVILICIFIGSLIGHKKDVGKMTGNVVLQDVVRIAKEKQATGIYVFTDCVHIVYGQHVITPDTVVTKLKTQKEYDEYEEPSYYGAYRQVAGDPAKIEQVMYASYSYPNMDYNERLVFADAVAKLLPGYKQFEKKHRVEHFVERYFVDGGLSVTPYGDLRVKSGKERGNQTLSKEFSLYFVLIAESQLQKAPPKTEEKPMNQW